VSRVLGVIPARMGSSRFPGKPLAPIHGLPMIEHVYRGTAACDRLDEVVIATCDAEIARAAESFGARVVLTSASHERASDRVAEVSAHDPADLVVMVQGDEPMVRPEMVARVIEPLQADAKVMCVNLAAPILEEADLVDPNTIKVVTSRGGDALYFSRQPIPHAAVHPFAPGLALKQVCVIGFRRAALQHFTTLAPGRLECAESIDMLRFLEHGVPVRIAPAGQMTQAVDTPADLARVAALMPVAEGHPGRRD
jgi:3-deoxy-manno-octulosonate cytidylyltransferase (CMP-KDO synthetase)